MREDKTVFLLFATFFFLANTAKQGQWNWYMGQLFEVMAKGEQFLRMKCLVLLLQEILIAGRKW